MNIKKIEYLTQDLISPYVRETYPLFAKLIKSFSKYLDQNNYGKILFIDDNLDPYNAFKELLNLMLNEFFSQTFDFDVYDLTDDNKRRFIDLAEKINGLKGNKQSFAVFFQTFVNFSFATGSGIVSFPTLGTVELTEPTAAADIYKYVLNVDSADVQGFESLIENIHPAGIKYFLIPNLVDDDPSTWSVSGGWSYNSSTQTHETSTFFDTGYVDFYDVTSAEFQSKTYELSADVEIISLATLTDVRLTLRDGVTADTTVLFSATGSYSFQKTMDASATKLFASLDNPTNTLSETTEVKITNVVLKEII